MNGKKICEAAMLGGALVLSAASFDAMASTACSAGVASSVTGSTTNFVKNTFAVKCSANVDVDYADNGSDFGVKGRSIKGKTVYGGSTTQGGVTVCTVGTTSVPALGSASAGTGC